jgi:hypothetical protein
VSSREELKLAANKKARQPDDRRRAEQLTSYFSKDTLAQSGWDGIALPGSEARYRQGANPGLTSSVFSRPNVI